MASEIEQEQTDTTEWDLILYFLGLLLLNRHWEKGRTRMEQVRLGGFIQFSIQRGISCPLACSPLPSRGRG
jgi:hypothetical protein